MTIELEYKLETSFILSLMNQFKRRWMVLLSIITATQLKL